MKVLELLASPVWTGPAEPMASVARQLVRLGHQVEVAVDTRREGDLRERLRGLGLTVRDDFALTTQGGPALLLGDVRRLRAIARGFDVVHANFSHDHALALIGARGRSRVVRTVHSERSLRDRMLQGLVHRRTDGLIAVCEAHARLLRERFKVSPERVLAVRGAVDASAFTPGGPDLRAELGIPPDAPVAGIVSRVKPGRGHDLLLNAFVPIAARLPAARLVVVGRGEGLDALRASEPARKLGPNLVFAGYRTGAALAAAYRTLDVKVLLAEGNDGSCRALLEAMACGRAAIAARFGAPAETVVEGETGRLVPPDDREALAQALLELLSDRDRARRLGEAGRARVSRLYTERARGEAVESFLRRIALLPPA